MTINCFSRTITFVGIVLMTTSAYAQKKHDVFDIKKWSIEAACDTSLKDVDRTSIHKVASPYQLTFTELHRARILTDKVIKEKHPVDVFVWDVGEPRKPYLTKIGGVPYRDRNTPWPKIGGRETTFIGQICFVDSLDLCDKEDLKGDVLLLFCAGEYIGSETKFSLEWSDVGMSEEQLIASDECPNPKFKLSELHGIIHRSNDLVVDMTDEFYEYLVHEINNHTRLQVFDGTKIGGLRPLIGDDDISDRKFVASIGAVAPGVIAPDFDKPISQQVQLSIGDMGSLMLYVGKNGEWSVEMVIH